MRTRPLIVSKMESYIREKEVELYSERLIEELFTFIWNGHKSEAMRGYNDDLVLSLCIALWVRDTAIRLRGDGIEKQKTMLDFMGSTLALEKEGVYKNPLPGGINPYEMHDGHGGKENLEWLLD